MPISCGDCDGSVFKISDRVLSLVNGVQAVKTSETATESLRLSAWTCFKRFGCCEWNFGNSELNGGTFIVKHVQDPNTIT